MANDPFSLYITKGSTVYRFTALSNISATNGVEISAEPGVMPRIGPRTPRKFTVKVTTFTSEEGDPFHYFVGGTGQRTTARKQYEILEGLIAQEIEIDARALTSSAASKKWTVESVRAVDQQRWENSFTAEVSFLELRGGKGLPKLRTGRIEIPQAVGEEDADDSVVTEGNCEPAYVVKKKQFVPWLRLKQYIDYYPDGVRESLRTLRVSGAVLGEQFSPLTDAASDAVSELSASARDPDTFLGSIFDGGKYVVSAASDAIRGFGQAVQNGIVGDPNDPDITGLLELYFTEIEETIPEKCPE